MSFPLNIPEIWLYKLYNHTSFFLSDLFSSCCGDFKLQSAAERLGVCSMVQHALFRSQGREQELLLDNN